MGLCYNPVLMAINMTIRQLARLTGLDPGGLSRLFRGEVRNPSVDTMLRLSRALDLGLDETWNMLKEGWDGVDGKSEAA